MKSPTTLAFGGTTSLLVVLAAGCMTAPMQAPRAGGENIYSASKPILVEQPGIITKIMLPPREIGARAFMGVGVVNASPKTGDVPSLSQTANGIHPQLTAVECAAISGSDGQEYELLVISPDQTAGVAGRADYCVILWNQAGIDWYAEILLEVSWQSAQKPYAKVVYRNTKVDSCLFVENGSKEGSWKVIQKMKFGQGAPAKEYASKARNLSSFPPHKSSQQR